MSESKGIIARISESMSSVGGAIKGAVGAAREIQNLTVDYVVKEKTHSLLDKLMDVQMQQMSQQELFIAAKERIIELENEKKQREQWDTEKSNYFLYEVITGTLVYRVDTSKKPDTPLHDICPSCYEHSVKSILQLQASTTVQDTHFCPTCKVEFRFPSTTKLGEYIRVPRSSGGW